MDEYDRKEKSYYCSCCGMPLRADARVYDVDGWICEECAEDYIMSNWLISELADELDIAQGVAAEAMDAG